MSSVGVGGIWPLYVGTRERSVQLMIGLAMPILFVAGLAWPSEALPPLLQGLRWALPSTAGIQGFVALNQLGANWSEIAPEVLALSILLPIFTVLAAWRWRIIFTPAIQAMHDVRRQELRTEPQEVAGAQPAAAPQNRVRQGGPQAG